MPPEPASTDAISTVDQDLAEKCGVSSIPGIEVVLLLLPPLVPLEILSVDDSQRAVSPHRSWLSMPAVAPALG